ncbi:hypothetical protein BH23VER1_BH23VER1_02350 [soil metagenome]
MAMAVAGGAGFFLAFMEASSPEKQPRTGTSLADAPPAEAAPTRPAPLEPFRTPDSTDTPDKPDRPGAPPVPPEVIHGKRMAARSPTQPALVPLPSQPVVADVVPAPGDRPGTTTRQDLEDRARIVEETANRELQRLIPRLHLSELQQDRVFVIATATSPYFSSEMIPEVRTAASDAPADALAAPMTAEDATASPMPDSGDGARAPAPPATPDGPAPEQNHSPAPPQEAATPPPLPPKEELILHELTPEQQEEYARYVGEVDTWWEAFAEAEEFRIDHGVPLIGDPPPQEVQPASLSPTGDPGRHTIKPTKQVVTRP